MRKRLALAGSYNTRPGTQVLSGTSGIVGIGIVGLMIIGNTASASGKDYRLINCFKISVVDPDAGKKLYVVDRAGFAASSTPRAGHVGNDIHVWAGQGTGTKVMSAFGNTNFKLFDGTTDKGDGTGKATWITETSVSGTPTLFITSDDNEGWTYQDGGALTNISDADFPGNASRTLVGMFVHLDGYPFIMDSVGRVYNGDLNSASAWTAASYKTANSTPDVGVGLVRLRSVIIAFCKEHFDVFRNAGNPAGSPLSMVEGSSQSIGCISANAITSIGDTVYFIGTTKGANLALYAYGGSAIQSLSTPEQEAAFAIAGPSNITITKAGQYGRHFIVVIAASSTFVYCIEENDWHEWTGTQLWFRADGVAAGASIVSYAISNDSTSGKIYVLNPGNVVYADDAVPYTATIQTKKWDTGTTRRKFASKLSVLGDQLSGDWNIAWYDDDYQTASTPRSVSMSSENPRLTRLGSFIRRAHVLTHTANGARAEELELEFELGST